MAERAEAHSPAPIVRVEDDQDIAAALAGLGVGQRRPVLVLVGGAAGMGSDDGRAVDRLLRHAVLPAVVDRGATIVDGGTDSGVMRSIGRARSAAGAAFPLVGVAAAGTVRVPGGGTPVEDSADLEPHHTQFVLVPGRAWGAEAPWIARVADVIAVDEPSVTLLVNGGDIAYDDVALSLQRGRPVVVLAGTGRTADAITAAREGSSRDPRATRLASSALTRIVPGHDVDAVRAAVAAALA